MTIGAFSNAILRNAVMTVGSVLVTGGVASYVTGKYDIATRDCIVENNTKKKVSELFVDGRLVIIAGTTLAFANLAYGLGGSLGNHYFNTAAKWTFSKTVGQISTQIAFGTLLCGIAAIAANYFIGPQLPKNND